MADKLHILRARRCLGVRFCLHGRDPDIGLDCVGLVGFAFGGNLDLPTGYALRTGNAARWLGWMDQHFRRRRKGPRPGDILMMRAGSAQLHLGLWTGNSLIHANAQRRLVEERPGPPPWEILGAWGGMETMKGTALWQP